jgi:hypothetical protein
MICRKKSWVARMFSCLPLWFGSMGNVRVGSDYETYVEIRLFRK